MDLNFDGLMLESHIDPDQALSDASQQITPDELHELLSRLILRNPVASDPKLLDILGELRQQIDVFDDGWVDASAADRFCDHQPGQVVGADG